MDASTPPTPRNIRDLRNIPLAELADRAAEVRAKSPDGEFNSSL